MVAGRDMETTAMRETFTNTLRSALAGAQAAARSHNQDFVGTEHLMLGLLDGDGEAVRTLRAAHAEAPRLRSSLDGGLPRGAEPPVVTGDLPLSPKAQRVINGALVKAQSLREPRVSTRLLLMSLLDDVPPAVRAALDAGGVDTETLAAKLAERPVAAEA
jgi:ATP-dependent Clp protease ATP-binding subunit ClpA